MKHINFITPVSPNKIRALRYWLVSTLLLILLASFIFCWLYVSKKIHVGLLADEYALLERRTKKFDDEHNKRMLMQEHNKRAQKKKNVFVQLQNKQQQIVMLVQSLHKGAGRGVELQSIQNDRDRFTVKIRCARAQDALEYVTTMKTMYKEVALVNLEHHTQHGKSGFLASIRGAIVPIEQALLS